MCSITEVMDCYQLTPQPWKILSGECVNGMEPWKSVAVLMGGQDDDTRPDSHVSLRPPMFLEN